MQTARPHAGRRPVPVRRMTAGPGTPRRLADVVRRRPVACFLLWSFPVGQAVAFVPVVAREVHGADLPAAPFVVLANLVGLLLPALVITRVVDGPAGLRALLRRAVRVRVPLRWYGLALVVVPLSATAVAIALLGVPVDTGGTLAAAVTSGLMVQLLLGLVTTNWAEEVAWTGFLQSRLQERHGPVRAALATGPLFAVQHASLAAGNGWLGAAVVLLFITAMAVPFRFLQGWVANRSGSLLVVGLAHAAGNASTDGSGFLGDGLLPRLYPGDAVGPVHLLASAALGLLVLAATRGRLGARPAHRTDPVPSVPPPEEQVMSKRLSTHVDIEARPERVWEVLTDLAAYPEWNPFIVRADGAVRPGRRLTLRMQPVGGRVMTVRPWLRAVTVNRELRWSGTLGAPGLLDAEHTFTLQPLAGGTRLIQSETFRGVLVPFVARTLDRTTLPAFVAMNEALARRAEVRAAVPAPVLDGSGRASRR